METVVDNLWRNMEQGRMVQISFEEGKVKVLYISYLLPKRMTVAKKSYTVAYSLKSRFAKYEVFSRRIRVRRVVPRYSFFLQRGSFLISTNFFLSQTSAISPKGKGRFGLLCPRYSVLEKKESDDKSRN